MGTVSTKIQKVLNEYVDIISPELPKTLPHRQRSDHEVKLVPWNKPPTKNAYQMALPELAELRKQLDELLTTKFIRPAKVPYGAPVLFQKKKDGTLDCA